MSVPEETVESPGGEDGAKGIEVVEVDVLSEATAGRGGGTTGVVRVAS
jgi:hypothetical protein